MQIPLNGYGRNALILFKFVWRQSGFAFFGALASVGALFYFGGIIMKKWLAVITIFAVIISLTACSFLGTSKKIIENAATMPAVDESGKEAINKAVTRIRAGELDAAINVLKTMDDNTLSEGKNELVIAVIDGLEQYLDYNSWVSTNYEFVDGNAIKDIEKYQTIVNYLLLTSEESNVDSFIEKALMLKKYTKWNDFHRTDAGIEFVDIKSTMDQGAVFKSDPTIASQYYKQAYDDCMTAYDKYSNYAGYGMQEVANFYYNFAVQTNAIILQKGTTDAEDNAFNDAASAFKRIQQEFLDAFEDVIDICDTFPKELY